MRDRVRSLVNTLADSWSVPKKTIMMASTPTGHLGELIIATPNVSNIEEILRAIFSEMTMQLSVRIRRGEMNKQQAYAHYVIEAAINELPSCLFD